MSKGIGKLQQQILSTLVQNQTGEHLTADPNGDYATHISLLHKKLNATDPTFKRSIRRALQSLHSRGLVRRDGKRRWCAVTPELEAMRERRDREFEEILERMRKANRK